MTTTDSTGRFVSGGPSAPVHVTNAAPIPIYPSVPAGTDPLEIEYTAYGVGYTGELAGSATAVQMPNIAARLVKLKAVASNAGNVYIGFNNSVSKPNGTTDGHTGFELAPGDDSGWWPIDNLNRLWRICDNAGDDLTYSVLV